VFLYLLSTRGNKIWSLFYYSWQQRQT